MNINERVMLMNLANLSPEDLMYLHKLKALATVLQCRLQLKHGMIGHDISDSNHSDLQKHINKETL